MAGRRYLSSWCPDNRTEGRHGRRPAHNRRRPATVAQYPPCPEELEDARRRPAMSTPYPQSHGHPSGDTSSLSHTTNVHTGISTSGVHRDTTSPDRARKDVPPIDRQHPYSGSTVKPSGGQLGSVTGGNSIIPTSGGDVTEQTSIQIRRGSTATDSPPVEDDVEQFSAREEEELTEARVSREGQPIVPSSGCEDPLRYEDPVMHISGTGHWFLEGWIGDPFSRVLGGFGVFSDSDVRHFLSKPSTCRRTIRRTPDYSKDATQRKWYWH